MIPFMSEAIYRNLVCSIDKTAPESVHLCDFPEVEPAKIDKSLEENMERVLKIVVLGRAARNTANIKQRQPVQTMYVKSEEGELPEFFREIIADELNVKEVQFTQDVRSFTSYTFKPQLKTLGRRFGSRLNALRTVLSGLDGNAAMDELGATGKLTVTVEGTAEDLTAEDLLIESVKKEGYVTEADGGVTVVLDTNLTAELVEEGYVRELISKVQTMRKDAGFEVMDHIRVSLNGNEKLAALAQKNAEAISGKVLAEELTSGKNFDVVKEWNVNGEKVVIAVEKIG